MMQIRRGNVSNLVQETHYNVISVTLQVQATPLYRPEESIVLWSITVYIFRLMCFPLSFPYFFYLNIVSN